MSDLSAHKQKVVNMVIEYNQKYFSQSMATNTTHTYFLRIPAYDLFDGVTLIKDTGMLLKFNNHNSIIKYLTLLTH